MSFATEPKPAQYDCPTCESWFFYEPELATCTECRSTLCPNCSPLRCSDCNDLFCRNCFIITSDYNTPEKGFCAACLVNHK